MSDLRKKTKILFVCLGNICRSAAAEAIMKHYVEKLGKQNEYEIDSAGTAAYHAGETADPRMIAAAARRGYRVDSISRQIREADMDAFDLILTMDRNNYRDVLRLCKNETQKRKVKELIRFVPEKTRTACRIDSIPDPYYGGDNGFLLVLDVLEQAIPGIIASSDKGNISR